MANLDLFVLENEKMKRKPSSSETIDFSKVRLIDGSFYVEIAPPTLGSNTLFKLPNNNGSNGQVLSTDGSGNTSWVASSGGGGSGGVSLEWVEDSVAPLPVIENSMMTYQFQSAGGQALYALVRVPNSYLSGNQIKLKLSVYSPDSSGTALIQTVSTLIRKGVDAVTSTANQRTSSNAAITLSAGTVNVPQEIEFDISSPTGQINSVSISAGDFINIKLQRGTDTSLSDTRVLVYGAEVSIV